MFGRTRFLALLSAVLVAQGCAFTDETVGLNYRPLGTPRMEGVDGVCVSLEVRDRRQQYRDRVSSKRNGFGIETAAVHSLRPLPDLVREGIETELRALGFRLCEDGARLEADIETFYADIRPGFFTGDVVAEVALSVRVLDAAGELRHAAVFRGLGHKGGIVLYTGDAVERPLEQALQRAVYGLVHDEALLEALRKGRGSRGLAGGLAAPSAARESRGGGRARASGPRARRSAAAARRAVE